MVTLPRPPKSRRNAEETPNGLDRPGGGPIEPPSPRAFHFEEFTLDLARGCLLRRGEEVRLRPKVFEALSYLVRHDNRLVSKDELMKALWPETFVTDDSLVQCVVELRRALGDEAQACLKTVPRRGYVFAAAVTASPSPPPQAGPAPAPGQDATPVPRPTRALVAVALGVAVVAAGVALSRRPGSRPAALTDKDSVLIADFVNRTGNDVFDGTLRAAVAVHLEQRPFLNVVSDERVRETLRYMGRPAAERLTLEVARDVAQRQGATAVLAGSIAPLGRHYVLGLQAVGAASGDVLAREQIEAEGEEQVLARLGEAATRLRERMGESLTSIERFAAPIEQATTPSLAAFKAYDLGRQRHFAGRYLEAIPFYERAVELDPGFAIAHAALGVTYGSAQESDLAARASQRAYELRERVSERERLYISVRYFVDVLDDDERAIEALELWKQTYPRDFVPRTNLSARYAAIGQYERALEEARDGLRLNPEAGVAYAGVAHSALCLGRLQDAREALAQATLRNQEAPYGRYMAFAIAFLEGDRDGMQSEADRVVDTPLEAGMLALQSVAEAYSGRVGRARELTDRSIETALARSLQESAGLHAARGALWEAAYGFCAPAKARAARSLALSEGRRARSQGALALALCDEPQQARRLTAAMVEGSAPASSARTVWAPIVESAMALRAGDAKRAIDLLRGTGRVEAGTVAGLWPAYLRGLAQLELGRFAEAAAEFQKVLDHRGVLAPKDFAPVSLPLHPLATLGHARALAGSGDVEESRRGYAALFTIWKDADPGLPILREARREYARLTALSAEARD